MEKHSIPESLDSTSRHLPSLVGDDDIAVASEEPQNRSRLPQQGVAHVTQAAGTSNGVNVTLPNPSDEPKILSRIRKERMTADKKYYEKKKLKTRQMEIDIQDLMRENGRLRSAEKQRIQWTLLLISFIVEGLSSAFDQLSGPQQPIYALMAMLMAFSGLMVSIIEVYYRVQERNNIRRLLEDGLANFGFFASTWQCIYSIIEYNCIKKKLDNPIKMSVLPLIFLVCVAISRLCSYCRGDQISSNGQQRSPGMDV